MQIEKIIIKNYKGIENFSYEPKHKIGILAGHIGLGKSTFLESIQSVVTGEMSRSNIRKGQGECMISMDVYNEGEEPVSIKRCYFIDKASQHFLKGRRGSKKNLDQYIEENIIHMPIEDFQIASSSDILTSMRPHEFNDFVLKFIPQKITINTLFGCAPLSEDAKMMLVSNIKRPEAEISVTELTKLCEKFREENRWFKNNAAELKASLEQTVLPNKVLDQVQIQAGFDKVSKDEADYRYYCDYTNKQKQNISSLQNRKNELQTYLASHQFIDIPYSSREYVKIVKGLQETVNTYKEQKVMDETNIRTNEEYLIVLKSDTCPLNKNIHCSTDKMPLIQTINEYLVRCKENLKALDRRYTKAQEQLEKYQKSLEYVLNAEQNNAQIQSVQKELQRIEATLNQIVWMNPVNPYDYQGVRKEWQEESDKLQVYLRYQETLKKYNDSLHKIEVYNELINFLKMKGPAINYITSHYVDPFNDIAERRLSTFEMPFAIDFYMDNGLTYRIIKKEDGTELQFCDLSSGEKRLVSFVLVDIINLLTNTRILYLDDLDHLDKKTFKILFDMISAKEFLIDYDHVFLSMVDHEDLLEVFKESDQVDRIM